MADFTTIMTTVSDISDSVVELMDKQFIVAQADMGIMDQLVTYKSEINAKSIEFPKYSQLALATTPLVEKDDLASEALVDAQVILTPAEYGNVVTPTKLASLQSGGKVDIAASRLTGMNAQRTLDKLAVLAAEASANSLTVTGLAENLLVATDVMTATFLNVLYNKLSRANIMPLVDGSYVAVMHDDVIHDLRSSVGTGSWTDISKYSNPEMVLKNEIGRVAGFRILRDNNITITADGGAAAVDTYKTICMGFNALGKAESAPLKQTITGPFDKLGRFLNIGFHTCVDYGIVDQDALWVGISASSVGNNAA